MEQRLANTWRMTVNEKRFIETALCSGLRVDGRRRYDYRELTIKFGREDGSSEVHLGQTRILGFVTSQLVLPYRDRPNEGTLSIFTEFSPMADPSFEAGRPGESAIELGRIIDRGLRESRAVDTESLCVVSGKFVWSIRIDLHILDNGGNLVDAANIAALAALSTFRRPECTLGEEDGQEVIVHPAEVREPLPLIIHHLPIAVTFAFFGEEKMVIDPTHFEEAVMGGRMTATLNTNGDVCAIQKAGGEGVTQSVIMGCLTIAREKAADITTRIKDAVDSYNSERALRKIKRHPLVAAVDVGEPSDLSRLWIEKVELKSEQCGVSNNDDMDVHIQSSKQEGTNKRDGKIKSTVGALSSWDPYSKGINSDELKISLASRGPTTPVQKPQAARYEKRHDKESNQLLAESDAVPSLNEMAGSEVQKNRSKTLEDAVKPKHRRRNKASFHV